MANNRIYIRCTHCGETLRIGSTYLSGYFFESSDGTTLDEKINRFYAEHAYCSMAKVDSVPYNEKAYPMPEEDIPTEGDFDIVYEE